MASMERKNYENLQLTSTPRVCRRPYSLQDAFVEVSPILPIKACRERSKSLIPVSTGNRPSVLLIRRIKEYENNCDNSVKTKITSKVSLGPALPSIPEHGQLKVMAVPESRPSSTNILKDTKISNLAQVEWKVPHDTKKRFSLKYQTIHHGTKESVLLNPEQNIIKDCGTDDEMSPLELSSSTKKIKIGDKKYKNQNCSQNNNVTIENPKAPLPIEDGLQICDSKLEDGQSRGSKLNDNSKNNDVTNIRTRSNRLNKRKHEQTKEDNIISDESSKPHSNGNCQELNTDSKKPQLKANLKSKRTMQKEIQEAPEAGMSGETNNAKLPSAKQLPKSRVSKRKNNVTKGRRNEFIDCAVSKSSFVPQNNIISEVTNVEPTTPKLRKKLPPKKNNCNEINTELSLINNKEHITMVNNNNNDKAKGRTRRKVCTETIETITRPESDLREEQKNNCTKEQHNTSIIAIGSDSTSSCKSNNHLNREKKDSTKCSTKKKVLTGRKGKAVNIDKCTVKNPKDMKDEDDNINIDGSDGFKSQQINNKTCIIVSPKNSLHFVVGIDFNNGNNDINVVRNPKMSHRNVPGAQELSLKHGRKGQGNESKKGNNGLTNHVNDDEKKSTNEIDDMILQEKTSKNNEAVENLKTSESRKRKINSIKKNQEEFVSNQELYSKTQHVDDRTCIIVQEGKRKDNQEKSSEESGDFKSPQDVVLQTGKVKIKSESNAENNSRPNHKDEKLNNNRSKKVYIVPDIKNDNKENYTINERKITGKVNCDTEEENTNSQEGVFQDKKPMLTCNDKATDRRSSSRMRMSPKDYWTNQAESDKKSPRSKSVMKVGLNAANQLPEKCSYDTVPLAISDVNKCLGLKKEKITMKEGSLMQTLVHVQGYVMTGSFSIQPGCSLTRSSTDTAYFVTSGAASVRIGPVTRIIRCQDVNCSFFIPKCSDFSITNKEDVLLKIYFTKFSNN